MPPLVITTPLGLYCPDGAFHVDPWAPVPRAVVTHAHTDHARYGCEKYLVTPTGKLALAARFAGMEDRIDSQAYGLRQRIGDVIVSLHPAGHVLGSAQVRIERATGPHAGETWVISGDYKTQNDGISEPFEPLRCHTFITESTFGLPIYRWQPQQVIYDQINAWWRHNADRGTVSMIACYALGKAQRVLHGLDASIGPILIHGALRTCTDAYRAAGIALPPVLPGTQENARASKGRAMVLAPPSAVRSEWAFKLPGPDHDLTSAMASGWMSIRGTRRRRALDTGFALSDHTDWPGLLSAIAATGAERIGVTHGAVGTVCRYLTERGVDAFPIKTQFIGEGAEDDSPTGADPAAAPAHPVPEPAP